MKKRINIKQKKWISRFDRMTERTIFFYATLIMLAIGAFYKLRAMW